MLVDSSSLLVKSLSRDWDHLASFFSDWSTSYSGCSCFRLWTCWGQPWASARVALWQSANRPWLLSSDSGLRWLSSICIKKPSCTWIMAVFCSWFRWQDVVRSFLQDLWNLRADWLVFVWTALGSRSRLLLLEFAGNAPCPMLFCTCFLKMHGFNVLPLKFRIDKTMQVLRASTGLLVDMRKDWVHLTPLQSIQFVRVPSMLVTSKGSSICRRALFVLFVSNRTRSSTAVLIVLLWLQLGHNIVVFWPNGINCRPHWRNILCHLVTPISFPGKKPWLIFPIWFPALIRKWFSRAPGLIFLRMVAAGILVCHNLH